MYKVIINGSITKEFKNIDKASEFYSENFKQARIIKLYQDNKLIAKKEL